MIPTLTITFEDGFDSHQGSFSRIDPYGNADVDYSSAAIEVAMREGWKAWFDLMPDAQFSENANIEIKVVYKADGASNVAWIDFPSVQDASYPAEVPTVFNELLTGIDINYAEFDATIGVGPYLGTKGGISAVMAHEFGHAFGVYGHNYNEKNTVFANLISDGFFLGENAILSHGGPVPVQGGGHIASSVASIMGGNSVVVELLDIAILKDLGFYVRDNSTFTATAGPNAFDGGAGLDTVSMGLSSKDATVSVGSNGVVTITDRNGTGGADTLTNIEIVQFSDKVMGLTDFLSLTKLNDKQFKELAEMYVAYFNRAPDAEGLLYWADKLAEGRTMDQIAERFFDQDETRALYTDPSDTDAFVTAVYANVLGRTPDADGFKFWTGQLAAGEVTQGAFVLKIILGAKNGGGANDVAYLSDKADVGLYFSAIKGLSDSTDGRQVLATFGDQSTSNKSGAKTAVDGHYADATASGGGEFIFNVVGIVSDPFADFA
jgi:hypothetical protein